MDFELMITSFPKLLNATVVTLKLLSLSLLFGLFIGLCFAVLRLNTAPLTLAKPPLNPVSALVALSRAIISIKKDTQMSASFLVM